MGRGINGLLVCENCGGHYELEDNESPEDFDDTCECGGKTKLYRKFRRDERCKIII
jgi:hypothetical protein